MNQQDKECHILIHGQVTFPDTIRRDLYYCVHIVSIGL